MVPIQHPADLRLAQAAIHQDPAAQDELMARLGCIPAMLRSRSGRIGYRLPAEELDELVQRSLAALWAKLPSYDGRAALESWACGIALFELLKWKDRLHASDRILELVEGSHTAARDNDPDVDSEAVAKALQRLGPPGDEIVRLRHFENMTFEEISKVLQTPSKTVMTRYYRALERLRVLLGPVLEDLSR